MQSNAFKRTLVVVCGLSLLVTIQNVVVADADESGYVRREIRGWDVRVSRDLLRSKPTETQRAIELLSDQIQLVERLMPKRVVNELRGVKLWLSPAYKGFRPTAEYHPNGQWLKKNGRPVAMERCVEFTNIPLFEREIRRMPAMLAHELAHAYHHQVLGFDNDEISSAYQAAKAGGLYDRVQRHDGKVVRAYAMSNAREYFAELSESYLHRNDFFPFTRDELERHDPLGFQTMTRVWSAEPSP